MSTQLDNEPARPLPKIVKAGLRSNGKRLMRDPKGDMTPAIKLSQWGTGRSNSGPAGRRKTRWYADRYSGSGRK